MNESINQLERHLIEMHYSRQPFDRITVTIRGRVKEQPRWNSLAVERGCSNILAAMLLHFVTLWPWPFDLILIGGQARYRDGLSLCQVWWFYFQPFWFYCADRQTHSRNYRITEADECYTHATTVGISNEWMNEWMNEMNEWINEWMNDFISMWSKTTHASSKRR